MVPKGSEPANTIFDWQADSYDAPALGGIVDGVDVISTDYINEASHRAKLHGRVQKFRKAFLVSDLAQNISDVAGIGKRGEMKRAISHAIIELKRNMEGTFCSDQDSQPDNGTTLPYLTRGMGKWTASSAQTDLPVPAAYLTPAASIITKTTATTLESDINGVCQSVYVQTGRQTDFDLICGTSLKSLFSSFAAWVPASVTTVPVRRYNADSSDGSIVNNIDFWQGDFGSVKLIVSLFLALDSAPGNIQNGRGYLINWENVELRYGRQPQYKDLPDLGGGPRGYVDAIAGLAVFNPLGFAKVAPTA
jgi:hypothetical protein